MRLKMGNEKGVTFIEYIVATAILAAIFILANILIMESAMNRAEKSQSVVYDTGPCGLGGLLEDGEC